MEGEEGVTGLARVQRLEDYRRKARFKQVKDLALYLHSAWLPFENHGIPPILVDCESWVYLRITKVLEQSFTK